MFRITKIFMFAVMLMLVPVAAWAMSVSALKYTDTNNTQQNVSPSKIYINPAGPLSLDVVTGYLQLNSSENMITYNIRNSSGQSVASGQMTFISLNEFRQGYDYNGVWFTTATGLTDGTYNLVAGFYTKECTNYQCNWSDESGNCTGYICLSEEWIMHHQSPTYTLVVDRTPPAAGELRWSSDDYNGSIVNNELVGAYGIKNILVNGISDAGTGIDHVQFESFNPSDGSVYFSLAAPYDSATQTAAVGTGQPGSVSIGTHLPNTSGPLGLRFNIYDKVGNKRVAQATVNYQPTIGMEPPNFVSWQYYRAGIGWSDLATGDLSLRTNTTAAITKIRAVVDPRPYDQFFVEPVAGSCTIPAGQTECTIETNIAPIAGTMKLHNTACYVRDQYNFLTSSSKQTLFEWDLVSPSITSYNLDRENKSVTFQINEPQTGAFGGDVGVAGGWLKAINSATGQEVQVNGMVTPVEGDNHQAVVNYVSLPEGNWQFTLWVQDNFGNIGSLTAEAVTLDQTPPQIAVYKGVEMLAEQGSVTSLNQINIKLSDNLDPNPELTGARLEGAGISATLGYHLQSGGYVLDYPPMFNGDYSLVMTARDASGNVATRTLAFSYAPTQINITSTGQETLNLPVIPADVVHTDGTNPLNISLSNGGSPLSGSYDLLVKSGSSSTTTLTVQGVTIAPGEQKSIPGFDFSASGGRLTVALRAEEPGQVDLLVTGNAPEFPIIASKVKFWRPDMQLSADPNWAVQPIIQKQRLNLVKGAQTPCRLTMNEQEANNSDPINDPVCLVQWNGLPANYTQAESYAEGMLPQTGDYTPGYEIFIFNNGQKHQMATGAGQALARLPIQDLSFTAEPSPSAASYYRKIQPVTVKLKSNGAYTCPVVTTTLSEAQEKGSSQVACLVRWVSVPEGLKDTSDLATPKLGGNFALAGDQAVSWAVDLYSPYGMLENVTAGSAPLSVVNPPLPELSFEVGLYGEMINDTTYLTSELSSGEVGKAKFGAKVSNANLTLELEGTNEGHTSRQYWSQRETLFSQIIRTGELNAWQTRQITAKLYYTDMPDVVVEKAITIYGVPSKRIKAVLSGSNEALDIAGVPVKLAVGIPSLHDSVVYNSLTEGDWRARFGYLDRQNNFQALTEYQPIVNGTLETTVSGLEVGFQKLVAEVEMVPPAGVDFYNRSMRSNLFYSVVLKGTAPEGEIYSRTLTGPAPLNAVLALQVESDTRRIMGAVVWQLSADNGSTWQDLEIKTPYQATIKVSSGKYLARAKMANQYSGAMGYSEAVELNAFKVAELTLTGPQAVIVGTPITLKSQVTIDGQAVAPEETVVEWYNRTGEKVFTGANLGITPAETGSLIYQVRARMAAAPESNSASWVKENAYVRVVPPSSPTGLIVVPNYMEYNAVSPQTYQITAKLNLALGLDPAMYPVEGEWRLPDGQVVTRATAPYSPTTQDADSHRALFEYVAWIQGFKEQTQVTLRRSVVVGTYFWPEFQVDVKTYPEVAPSSVTLTVAPKTGYLSDLEKPTYSWQIPASAKIERELDRGRVIQVSFPNAGSFDVGVTVTDARGSTAQASGIVALAEPAPFLVEFMPLFSNSLKRELLDVTLRTRVTGGHPQDRLSTYEFTVNSPDAQVTSLSGSGIIKGLRAGDYLAHLRAVSDLGKTVETDYPLSVASNKLPTCEVTSWDLEDYRWWKAVCQDTDGRVAGYRWYKGDQLISSGQTIRLKHSELTEPLRFEALDDAGGKYSENLSSSGG